MPLLFYLYSSGTSSEFPRHSTTSLRQSRSLAPHKVCKLARRLRSEAAINSSANLTAVEIDLPPQQCVDLTLSQTAKQTEAKNLEARRSVGYGLVANIADLSRYLSQALRINCERGSSKACYGFHLREKFSDGGDMRRFRRLGLELRKCLHPSSAQKR